MTGFFLGMAAFAGVAVFVIGLGLVGVFYWFKPWLKENQ